MSIHDLTPDRAVRRFLVLSALAAGTFYAAMYRQDNAMQVVDRSGYADPPAGLAWDSDRCWSNGKKLVASGWVVRKGLGANRRRVRVVVTDAEGRLRAVKTSLRQRDDISAELNLRFGDEIDYRHSGFTASLDHPPDGAAEQGKVFLAYDDDDIHALLPLACPRVGS